MDSSEYPYLDKVTYYDNYIEIENTFVSKGTTVIVTEKFDKESNDAETISIFTSDNVSFISINLR